jgi:hypothetical protein
LENKHPSSELKDQLKRNLPHVQKIPRWPPISDGKSKLAFQISAVAFQNESDWNETRFLYTARTNDAKTKDETDVVVVKFTRQYCPELHSFCAKQGRAPKLLGYGTVPGGWKVVVMERIKTTEKILFARNYWAKWNDGITQLMQDFHAKGWVHGDLRSANLVISAEQPDKIMLLDFDWGGTCREVFYPTALLNQVLVDKTVDDLRITKENDIRVLKTTFEELQRA